MSAWTATLFIVITDTVSPISNSPLFRTWLRKTFLLFQYIIKYKWNETYISLRWFDIGITFTVVHCNLFRVARDPTSSNTPRVTILPTWLWTGWPFTFIKWFKFVWHLSNYAGYDVQWIMFLRIIPRLLGVQPKKHSLRLNKLFESWFLRPTQGIQLYRVVFPGAFAFCSVMESLACK